MDLENVTYVGPTLESDVAVLEALPSNLRGVLEQINGFILLQGGFMSAASAGNLTGTASVA